MKRLLYYLVSSLFFFFIFFPYITIIPLLNVDIQPYALLISIILFVIVSDKKLPFNVIILGLPFVFSLFIMFIGAPDLNSIRSISNYASLFFISASVYSLLKMGGKRYLRFIGNFVEMVVYVWFIVGFIQTFFIKEFATILLPRSMSVEASFGRGVLGLAPEPTFYGITCLFLLLIVIFMNHKRKHILGLLLIMQIVLFAKSSMAVLFLILLFAYYILFRLSFKNILRVIIIVFLVITLTSLLLNYYFQGSRLMTLGNLILKDPKQLIIKDPSANDRYHHILFSFLGSAENYFMPHGYSEWSNYLDSVMPRYENVWYALNRTRIMSGYGSALFEIGIIALIIPWAITLSLYKLYMNDKRSFLIYAMFLNSMLITAIPLAFPLIGFVIGYVSYMGSRSDKEIVCLRRMEKQKHERS